MRFLRRALRRALARAGYRVARIPAQQIVPPGALAAQGIEAAGSHFPVLAAAVARTAGQGPVLELGMGDYSTPMLHLLCHDRLLVSADNSARWVARYEAFRSPRHELHFVDDWDRFVLLEARHWAVAFVDCSPVIRRVELVERLQGHARFIVVHDTETEPDQDAATVYAFEGLFARFRFRTDYRVFKPFTTILSDESPFELTAAEAVR
jgi:hypothetical protein